MKLVTTLTPVDFDNSGYLLNGFLSSSPSGDRCLLCLILLGRRSLDRRCLQGTGWIVNPDPSQ